ncbi:hypothetical protein SK128_015091 [Halocaridina rubra]|uniref:Uncharacterized protein n=1 Tax=Halocaridina rubra TaxID=373956 RepID=A0AAN8X0E0_HALRR
MLVSLLLTFLLVGVRAQDCQQDTNCSRPNCTCFSTESPLDPNFPPPFFPQFVVLSFNDAVTVTNFPFYNEILNTYKNPNDCGISGTFFVNHLYLDYTLANELWRLGSEIGVRSVTATPDISYWRQANYTTWKNEFSDMRDMLIKYAYIDEKDIIGTRVPYLELGGDEMFRALSDGGYQYDSSWPSLIYTNWFGSPPKGAIFPYTLDFKSLQDCPIGECPVNVYPGFWETPVVDLQDFRGEACAMIDACQSYNNETECPEQICEDNVFNFLLDNFKINYDNNKAPFGLHTHHSWFLLDELGDSNAHTNGYKRFLEHITTQYSDVWVISHSRLLEWMKNPAIAPDIPSQPAFQCPTFLPPTTCPTPLMCDYNTNLPIPGLEEINMQICSRPCPPNYPWLGNVNGS